MGAATSIRKLSVDAVALLEQLEPNAAELQRKRDVRALVQRALAREWPACRVLPFGSSESGTGFGGSDIDLGIYFADADVHLQSQRTMHERAQILATARARLADVFEVKEFIQYARVPVLKLWDPVRQVACDVSVGGVHALLNTALIKCYGRADPRVRPLAFAVKYWAKRRGINDSANGTLSSYGFSLLLIFYLQSRQSPILLPVIHTQFASLQSETNLSALLQRLHALPTVGPQPSTLGTSFQDSVGALLAGFFHFYSSEFNWEDEVVSVRMGAPLPKAMKWSHPVPWRISIEDPFELAHDVGRVIFNRKGQELLSFEFRRAYEMVCAGRRLDEICAADATSWDAKVSCYICDSSEHKARECVTLPPQPKHSEELRGGGTHSAAPSSAALATECWYCGESGHFKAACPMLFFRNIPLHSDWLVAPPYSPSPPVPPIPKSQPIPIPSKKSGGAGRSKWERGMSPPLASKKKKRTRQGSASLVLSPPLSPPVAPPPLASPSLLPKKRRTRRHRQQEQRCALAAVSASSSVSPSAGPSSAAAVTEPRMRPRKIDVVC